jgi:hypothetical protein
MVRRKGVMAREEENNDLVGDKEGEGFEEVEGDN